MYLSKPKIFEQFPNLIFGLSQKFDFDNDKYHFNMSKSIGDDLARVTLNRKSFFNSLGLSLDNVIVQKQIHSDIVNIVDKFKPNLTGDALITKKLNLGLAVSTADCTNIYLYDSIKKVIAAVHSGWAGTEKKILKKTIQILINSFNSSPANIYAYLGPSICQTNYEVGSEFLSKFDKKYILEKDDRLFLDLKQANLDILLEQGLHPKNIEVSNICSFGDLKFHSYRRDKSNSGRALGVIAIRG